MKRWLMRFALKTSCDERRQLDRSSFDSSVWISALHFRGVPLQALNLDHGSICSIAICDPILAEIHTALREKFDWRPAEVDEALANLSALDMTTVQTFGTICGICRDPKDDVIIECALMADAALIVTGDKDLLAVRELQGYPHPHSPRISQRIRIFRSLIPLP